MYKKFFKFCSALIFLFYATSSYAASVHELFHNSHDPVGGNKKGKVTLVEFFDYQCSHCVTMSKVIDQLIEKNSQLRIVYKEWPIRGPVSDYAARAALAANLQHKYLAFHQTLMNHADELSEDKILELAKEVGLNAARLKRDMQSRSIDGHINQTYELANDLKLIGTPAFFIGATNAHLMTKVITIYGQRSSEDLQTAIDQVS